MEYRSCIFTCSTDGCNGSQPGTFVSRSTLIVSVVVTVLLAAWMC